MRHLLLPVVLLTAFAVTSPVQAAPITYATSLSGANEAPPNGSPGTGSATVVYDPFTHTLRYDIVFSGLLAPTVAAHVHCCTTDAFTGTAGVATQLPAFPGFPLGVTSGTYHSAEFDLTQAAAWNPAFVTAQGGVSAAETAFAAGLASGRTYLNLHTAAPNGFPAGEIRGFLAVPEPGTAGLVLLGLAGLAMTRRRFRA
jgi:hypothetical protein